LRHRYWPCHWTHQRWPRRYRPLHPQRCLRRRCRYSNHRFQLRHWRNWSNWRSCRLYQHHRYLRYRQPRCRHCRRPRHHQPRCR
jgi:hypothetical protein